MKNIYRASSLLTAALLLALSLGVVPAMAFKPPSTYVTMVTLTCNGKNTSATATVTLTHNGQTLRSITLTCSNPRNHRSTGTITTELKPTDLIKLIVITVGDGSKTCSQHDVSIPYSAWFCYLHRGSALITIRPTH